MTSEQDSPRFTDVPEDHWAADDIDWLAETGITQGTNPPENTEFSPDAAVTRAQMAAFLRRLYDYIVEPIDEEPEPEPEPPPTVNEPFPDNPDIILEAGDSVQSALNDGHRLVELTGVDYGPQRITNLPDGTHVFSRDGQATFDGNHSVGYFADVADDRRLQNFTVQRYGQHIGRRGGSMIVVDGGTLTDMQVGISRMNAVRIQGNGSTVEGGRLFRCHRFAFHGAGHRNTVSGVRIEDCGMGDPEVGEPTDQNKGVCKVVLSSRWVVEDLDIENTYNGVWFDIANEPAVIRRIKTHRVRSSPVFVEVSYGDSGYGPWQVEDIEATECSYPQRGVEPSQWWPKPAVVSVSLTPDVHVRRVRTDGYEHCTVGFIQWNHSQLSQRDASRMGIDGELVEDCVLAGRGVGAGFDGDTSNGQVRRGDPVFRNNEYVSDTYRWKGDTLTAAQWSALGHS